MVEGLHCQGAVAAKRRKVMRGTAHGAGGKVGAVQLQSHTSLDNGSVLLSHRCDDRGEVGLVVAVVVILNETGDDAGRGRGHEDGLAADVSDRLLQVVDVGLKCVVTSVRNGSDTRGSDQASVHRARGLFIGDVERIGGSRGGVRPAIETGQTILYVGPVADLRHLAVVYDVDARLLLPPDDVHNGLVDPPVEVLAVNWFGLMLLEEEVS